MKQLLFLTTLMSLSSTLFAAPCVPGSLQDYISLGGTGCSVGAVTVNLFETVPGSAFATIIDPTLIGVTPGGTQFAPTLTFTSTLSAGPADLLESIFRLNASGPLMGGMLSLSGATATGTGAVAGILDICPGSTFAGNSPVGCPTAPVSGTVVELDGFSQPETQLMTDPTSFFDVFVYLSADGGGSGSATFTSATLTLQAVPEPAAMSLMGCGLLALVIAGSRRRRKNGGQI